MFVSKRKLDEMLKELAKAIHEHINNQTGDMGKEFSKALKIKHEDTVSGLDALQQDIHKRLDGITERMNEKPTIYEYHFRLGITTMKGGEAQYVLPSSGSLRVDEKINGLQEIEKYFAENEEFRKNTEIQIRRSVPTFDDFEIELVSWSLVGEFYGEDEVE
jgi:hypothetical protein